MVGWWVVRLVRALHEQFGGVADALFDYYHVKRDFQMDLSRDGEAFCSLDMPYKVNKESVCNKNPSEKAKFEIDTLQVFADFL